MKKITLSVTEEQELFLKKFAEKQHNGAKDNMATYKPIHVVQNKKYYYVPCTYENSLYHDDAEIRYIIHLDGEAFYYETDVEAIEDYYWRIGEKCPIPIKAFNELIGQEIIGVDGVEHFIETFNDYATAYGIGDMFGQYFALEYWENVAHFFIREEAEAYIQYQRHNLHKPRVYTFSPGMAIKGILSRYGIC